MMMARVYYYMLVIEIVSSEVNIIGRGALRSIHIPV